MTIVRYTSIDNNLLTLEQARETVNREVLDVALPPEACSKKRDGERSIVYVDRDGRHSPTSCCNTHTTDSDGHEVCATCMTAVEYESPEDNGRSVA